MQRGRRHSRRGFQEAELDITSFMNLMIILVPVLLMSMVFSHITVLDLKLPDLNQAGSNSDEKKQLELVIRDTYIDVNYPQGITLKRIENTEEGHDFQLLSSVLQEVKRQLRDKEIEKRDILILSEPDTSYQAIVSTMDTSRSFTTVVAASAVQAELFPEISLGDAPLLADKKLPGNGKTIAAVNAQKGAVQ
ncbi:biopolymer transporter ExbD [Porticoccus sp. GXU_MW_L64]